MDDGCPNACSRSGIGNRRTGGQGSRETKVRQWLSEDGVDIGLTDLNVNEPRARSGNRLGFLTYDTREHAVNAWNALRHWWFKAIRFTSSMPTFYG